MRESRHELTARIRWRARKSVNRPSVEDFSPAIRIFRKIAGGLFERKAAAA
jgi:hypothetical protein